MEQTVDLQTAVNAFADSWLPLLGGLAAVGVIAMALVELLKAVFFLRFVYHNLRFRYWLNNQCKKFATKFPDDPAPDADTALKQLVELATGGDAMSLFNLKADRFAGQLNAAVQVMLAYPDGYSHPIKAMAVAASKSDLDIFLSPQASDADQEAKRAYSDSRTRISNIIQRNLDALQIKFSGLWELLMQFGAIVISFILILIVLQFPTKNPALTALGSHFSWVVFAVIGGMIAPVASNLVSALKRAKGS